MKKFMLLVLCLFLLMNVSAFAEEKTNKLENDEFVTIDVSEIPEGIQPIRVKDEAEALRIINEMRSIRSQSIESNESIKTMSSDFDLLSSRSISNKTVSSSLLKGAAKFVVKASIDIEDSKIVNVYWSKCSLEGYTVGLGLSSETTVHRVSTSKKSIWVSSDATLDYYFLLETGFTKLYSEPISHSFTYLCN